MHGIRKVLLFCILTTILPILLLVIPLYLRHSFYADVAYAVTESDILEISDGISTLFCSEHTLRMNGTFNAFQMSHKPEVTPSRKHIRLKKSMSLPDDTLEYWGFYLLRGASVALSVCSRFQGASILVVKGEKNLRTCGLLEHNNNKQLTSNIFLPDADRQVKITFESYAQEINSKEETTTTAINYLFQNTATTLSPTETVATTTELPKITKNNKTIQELLHSAEIYIQNHLSHERFVEKKSARKLRHAKHRLHQVEKEKRKKELEEAKYEKKLRSMLHLESMKKAEEKKRLQTLRFELNEDSVEHNEVEVEIENLHPRKKNLRKRNVDLVKPPSLLDRGIRHGGNAGRNNTDINDESSVSSFENGLFTCYGGAILLAEEFEPSDQCTDVDFLLSGKHMQSKYDFAEDGYYYFIFYSDNDIVSNDIHAIFDIYKPTFQYENVTKSCINQTECSFTLSPLSDDRVIVEIPTRDGIEHEIDDMNLLISVCHPRMGVYVIFPIAVLFLVISCAFM